MNERMKELLSEAATRIRQSEWEVRTVTDAALVRAYEQHGSAQKVADALALPRETVRRRLKAAGIDLPRGRPPGYRHELLAARAKEGRQKK